MNVVRCMVLVLGLGLIAATTGCAEPQAQAPLLSSDARHAVLLFASGKSFEQITAEMKLANTEAARALVHEGIQMLEHRWFSTRYAGG